MAPLYFNLQKENPIKSHNYHKTFPKPNDAVLILATQESAQLQNYIKHNSRKKKRKDAQSNLTINTLHFHNEKIF